MRRLIIFNCRSAICAILLTLALLALTPHTYARELIVKKGPHQIDQYAIELLQLLLAHGENQYTLKAIELDITLPRTHKKLASKQLDIMWASGSVDLDAQARPIYFPIFKGLLGYRILTINKGDQKKFSAVSNLSEARRFTYGQMDTWADTNILQHNQLKVLTTSNYHTLFPMLARGRFDALPRGLFEPWNEIAQHPQYSLAVESNLLFIYRLPFYFFVRSDDVDLAAFLHLQLDAALADGRFDTFLFGHTLIQENLKKAQLKKRTAIFLDNPNLPDQTPTDKSAYWFDLNAWIEANP